MSQFNLNLYFKTGLSLMTLIKIKVKVSFNEQKMSLF